mmetsp:Transcript_821/g.1119  ORF Transcript_821/g.1119 Transcript_821/m.1119 type:complete len:228 (-) Transcript_821:1290-1973(-)
MTSFCEGKRTSGPPKRLDIIAVGCGAGVFPNMFKIEPSGIVPPVEALGVFFALVSLNSCSSKPASQFPWEFPPSKSASKSSSFSCIFSTFFSLVSFGFSGTGVGVDAGPGPGSIPGPGPGSIMLVISRGSSPSSSPIIASIASGIAFSFFSSLLSSFFSFLRFSIFGCIVITVAFPPPEVSSSSHPVSQFSSFSGNVFWTSVCFASGTFVFASLFPSSSPHSSQFSS